MGTIEDRIQELGIQLPNSPAPVANYVPVVRTGNLIYLSGVGPAPKPDGTEYKGKLGGTLEVEEGYDAARLTAVNLVARLKGYLGELDRVIQIVKLLSLVNSVQISLNLPLLQMGAPISSLKFLEIKVAMRGQQLGWPHYQVGCR